MEVKQLSYIRSRMLERLSLRMGNSIQPDSEGISAVLFQVLKRNVNGRKKHQIGSAKECWNSM